MKVYTETDVSTQAAQRVPDSASIRTWEVTGGSHVPASAVSPDPTDFRATLGGIQTREYGLRRRSIAATLGRVTSRSGRSSTPATRHSTAG
jgi:hypothetical protein